MPNLQTRIENLEQKITSDENLPGCILIVPESGRKNAEPDTSKIVRLESGGVSYARESQEAEDAFVTRVAEESRSRLTLPGAVPVLSVFTENTLSQSTPPL